MATLMELADKYGTDKRSEDHNYVLMYEKLLKTIDVYSLLEIGLGAGGSVKMWIDYFPEASIYCIENFGEENERVWNKADGKIEGLNLINGDSTLEKTWENVPYDLDVIIDDGDHHPDIQLATLAVGFSHLVRGGLYFIEDTHCGFTDLYTGKKDTLYPEVLQWVMNQQTPHVCVGGNFYGYRQLISGFAHEVYSYHFYKSVVVFEKA